MLTIVGTVPDNDFPLVTGDVLLKGDTIGIQDKQIPINRGTSALIAAAVKTFEVVGKKEITVYLIGDIGLGTGSRKLYEYLTEHLGQNDSNAITFHYLQPDVDWHNRVLFAVKEMIIPPVLIADAGFMYAAKMSGQAMAYDLFTPDIGELAFLADEEAPHPFYTRGFILQEENRVPEQIARAYEHDNAARYLLVKGKKDYIADKHGIQATIDSPVEDSMEAIGGTGDTLTGIVSALIASGLAINNAMITAARVNRLAGQLASPTPATQVKDIINCIPEALDKIVNKK